MPAADACQINKLHGAQPQTRTNKLIREATGRGEVKAALCLEERNVNEQFPMREVICWYSRFLTTEIDLFLTERQADIIQPSL